MSNPSQPSSPSHKQQELLRTILSRVVDDALIGAKGWIFSFVDVLNPTIEREEQIYFLKFFCDHSRFKKLIAELTKHIDSLPPAFVDSVFDHSHCPVILHTQVDPESILNSLNKQGLDRDDLVSCLEALFRCSYQQSADQNAM